MLRTNRALLVGRVLLALIFVVAGFGKITGFEASAGYMAAHGMQAVYPLLVIALILETLGGLALMAGFMTRYVALVLAAYLIPTTLIFHNFWDYSGMDRQIQLMNFLKNLSIMGGLVCVVAAGAGAYSLDRPLGRRSRTFARMYRPITSLGA